MLGVLLLAIGDFIGTGVLGIVDSTKLSCPYSPLPIGEPSLKARDDGLLISPPLPVMEPPTCAPRTPRNSFVSGWRKK